MSFLYRQQSLITHREIRSSLQGIYGIGWYKSIYISARLGLAYPFKFSNSNYYNMQLLSYVLDFFTLLEVRIKRFIYQNIKKSFDIGSYKGIRHKDSLPVRGQRSRTNAKTKKRIKIKMNE